MIIVNRQIVVDTNPDVDEGFISVVNITPKIQELMGEAYITNGNLTLFLPGTTASITTIEFEAGLISDFKKVWQRNVPQDVTYAHKFLWKETNAHSHIRASMLGASLVVPIINRRLVLGQYQQIVLVDFDNRPRKRQIVAQFMGE
jgi:secondary thiamine-phosphate synthase enzyme